MEPRGARREHAQVPAAEVRTTAVRTRRPASTPHCSDARWRHRESSRREHIDEQAESARRRAGCRHARSAGPRTQRIERSTPMTLVNDERAAAEAVGAPKHRIAAAGRDDAERLAASLAVAFYDDPVFRWFSPDDRRREALLPPFFDVFVE